MYDLRLAQPSNKKIKVREFLRLYMHTYKVPLRHVADMK